MIATVLMVLDVIVCIALIASVLMQSGRAQACQMRSAEAVVVPSSARVMMLIL